jgi:hypothetical protein
MLHWKAIVVFAFCICNSLLLAVAGDSTPPPRAKIDYMKEFRWELYCPGNGTSLDIQEKFPEAGLNSKDKGEPFAFFFFFFF